MRRDRNHSEVHQATVESGNQKHVYSGSTQQNPYLNDNDGYYLDWEGRFLGQIGGDKATVIYRTNSEGYKLIASGQKAFARKIGTLEDFKHLVAAVHGETLKVDDAKTTLNERMGIAHAILNWKHEKGSTSIKAAAKSIANVFRDGNKRTKLITDQWVVALLKITQTEDIELSKKAVIDVLIHEYSNGKAGVADNTGGANSWDGLKDLKAQYDVFSDKEIADGKWNKFEKGYQLNNPVSGVKSEENSDGGYLYRSTKIIGNTIFAKYSGK